MKTNYIPGTWEYKNHQLMMAGKNIQKQKIALLIAKHEFEHDDFFTPEQQVINIRRKSKWKRNK